MNHLIKQQLAKISPEANLAWDKALPWALLRIRAKPRNKEGIRPFEILFGRQYVLSYQGEDMVQMGEGYLPEYLIALGKQINPTQKLILGTWGTGSRPTNTHDQTQRPGFC